MKKKGIRQLILTIGFSVFSLGNFALALDLPPGGPPGDAWIEHNETSPVTFTYYTLDTENYRDFTYDEKIQISNEFEATFGDHVDVPSPSLAASWEFNCNGYVFLSHDGWLKTSDRDPFENVSPCGPIYIFSNHSAKEGYGEKYIYWAKCGNAVQCYHDNVEPYGAHYERWDEL